MAQLSTIISSILRDMIVAQHEANMYAVSLEEIYKKNGRLERFSLPSANIGEVEMELRYGVERDRGQVSVLPIFLRLRARRGFSAGHCPVPCTAEMGIFKNVKVGDVINFRGNLLRVSNFHKTCAHCFFRNVENGNIEKNLKCF